jgi:hypothetical protein
MGHPALVAGAAGPAQYRDRRRTPPHFKNSRTEIGGEVIGPLGVLREGLSNGNLVRLLILGCLWRALQDSELDLQRREVGTPPLNQAPPRAKICGYTNLPDHTSQHGITPGLLEVFSEPYCAMVSPNTTFGLQAV